MRFLLDHHIDPAVAAGLNARGHDAVTAWEEDVPRKTDRELVAYADDEQRIIATNDDDLLAIADERERHSGIVFVTEQQMPVGQMIRGLVEAVDDWETPENRVAFI
ncbi:MAG: DUF5615 family PIN-like protein [Candidatus Nanohaloarchaea archaeon]